MSLAVRCALVLGLLGSLTVPQRAGADTASDLEQARASAAAAQAEANAVAAEVFEANRRYQDVTERIEQLRTQMESLRTRIIELEDIVKRRAVLAYKHGNIATMSIVISTGDVTDAMRGTALLERANAADNAATESLRVARDDLDRQEQDLQVQRGFQQKAKDELEAKHADVEAKLAAANQARDELIDRLERERAQAAAAAELARLQALKTASQPRFDGGGAGQVIANPGGGAFQCPLSGSAYSANFGPRGSGFHYGIDMLAPTGVPEVAVKAGTVSFVPMGGAGGNEAYLAADDGNVYYYAHMSSFVGTSRRVAQGEVIGLVGSTGNSTTPHLHFEIRLSGANGQRVDPYPTLRGAGC